MVEQTDGLDEDKVMGHADVTDVEWTMEQTDGTSEDKMLEQTEKADVG